MFSYNGYLNLLGIFLSHLVLSEKVENSISLLLLLEDMHMNDNAVLVIAAAW